MFEFVRRFRKWVMIGTVILVSFAFGITGVVYSVLAPTRDPGEEVEASYSLSAVGESGETVTVKRKEREAFERRWNQFLVDHLNNSQLPFGAAMERGGRQYEMAIRLSMRRAMRNPFFRFTRYVQSQYGVDVIRNLLFLRSAGSGTNQDPVFLVPFEAGNTEDAEPEQLTRSRQRHWSREAVWRLHYVLNLAQKAGFSATEQEIVEVVKPFLNRMNQRGKARIGYRQFVEEQGRMSLEQFETTLKEFITILKFLGSISSSTALDADQILSGFDSDQGYGAMLVASIDHNRVRRSVYGSRDWRMRQSVLSELPTSGYVEAFREFSGNLGNTDDNRQSGPGGNSQADGASLEKRQFAYLYLPIDAYRDEVDVPSEERLRSYYENNKSEQFRRSENGASTSNSEGAGSSSTNGGGENGNTDQFLPFDRVKEQIRATLIRERALRSADQEMKKLINSTITRKEIRDEPVDFQQIASGADLKGNLQYRTSPLLDREDMTHYLKQRKGVGQSHLDKLNQVVYEQDPGADGGPGPYTKEPIWFDQGVVIPRLIRVESDPLTPSTEPGEKDGGGPSMKLSGFEEGYPLPSLQLKNTLRWKQLKQATANQVSRLQQRLVRQYETKRDRRWSNIEVMGPLVPPQYFASSSTDPTSAGGSGKKGGTNNKANPTTTWPPGTFRSELVRQDIRYQRRRWQAARQSFRQVVLQAGLDVQETEPFKLTEGPSDVELQPAIQQKLSGRGNPRQMRRQTSGSAELFEPLTGSGDDASQVAILHKKLPKSHRDLEEFLNRQRSSKIRSERSSYLRTNVVTLLEQADFTLTNRQDTGSSSGSTP